MEDGSFAPIPVPGTAGLSGRAGIDAADQMARKGYFAKAGEQARTDGQDFLWYLGCGPASPLFGKDKMTTFERYFISDKATHAEKKNTYYELQNDPETAIRILQEFGLNENGFISPFH